MGSVGLLSRRRGDRALALGLTLALFAASWSRHATFRSTDYDLAVVEQVLWKLANGHGATSTLTAWNAFADHFSPILLPFVALYRLAATPLWLFGAQAVALGLGVLCVRPLVRAAGLDDDGWHTRALLVAYVMNPAIWNAALFDFHTTTLAVPVLMIGITAALQSRHRTMWLSLAALCLLRDDLAIAGGVVAVMGWLSDDRRGRRQRALIVGMALVWTGVGTKLAEAMGSTRHWDVRYGYLGDSALDAGVAPAELARGAGPTRADRRQRDAGHRAAAPVRVPSRGTARLVGARRSSCPAGPGGERRQLPLAGLPLRRPAGSVPRRRRGINAGVPTIVRRRRLTGGCARRRAAPSWLRARRGGRRRLHRHRPAPHPSVVDPDCGR